MTVLQPGIADVSVEINLTGFPRSAFITFGVDPVETDPTLVGATIAGCISSAGSLNSIMDSSATWRTVTVRIGQDGGEPLVGVHTMSLTGGSASATTLPPNCAVLVHKRTALGGRRHRGRFYLPWVAGEATVGEDGTIGATQVTQYQTAVNAFRSALSTAVTPMVVLHSLGRTSVPAATPVSALTVDPLIATQRRRLGR